MNKKQTKLIMVLIEKFSEWTTSAKLAQLLNISDRQIRRYINDINYTFPNLIESSNQGYKINSEKLDSYYEFIENTEESDQKIVSPSERKSYIIEQAFNNETIHIYDIADKIYVSPSTIENDIKKINPTLKEYELSLQVKNGNIKIIGNEINKRKYIASQTSNKNVQFNLKDEVELVADYYNFGTLFSDIKKILNETRIYTNDYAISNIVLHVIIMIERLRNYNYLSFELPDTPYKNSAQFKAASQIFDFVCQNYHIEPNETELFQLMLVIDNNTSVINFSIVNKYNLSTYVPREIIKLTENIIKNLSEQYSFDVDSEEFFVKFTIHIYNLLSRHKHKYTIKHPFKDELKKNHPYIYDLAVYTAQLLKDHYDIYILIALLSF